MLKLNKIIVGRICITVGRVCLIAFFLLQFNACRFEIQDSTQVVQNVNTVYELQLYARFEESLKGKQYVEKKLKNKIAAEKKADEEVKDNNNKEETNKEESVVLETKEETVTKEETKNTEEEIKTTKEKEQTNRWNIKLTDEEYELLAYITMREAGDQCDKGQQAVVECIFNRMYSVEFPDTLLGVVSQKTNGVYQFSSYPTRTKFEPTDRVYANIDLVLNGETKILPFKTLYFSTQGQKGMEVQTVIQDHVFNNQPNYIERLN